eukprot:IDg18946t1
MKICRAPAHRRCNADSVPPSLRSGSHYSTVARRAATTCRPCDRKGAAALQSVAFIPIQAVLLTFEITLRDQRRGEKMKT